MICPQCSSAVVNIHEKKYHDGYGKEFDEYICESCKSKWIEPSSSEDKT